MNLRRRVLSRFMMLAILLTLVGQAGPSAPDWECEWVGSSYCDRYGGCGGCTANSNVYFCTDPELPQAVIIIEGPGDCCICT